VNGRRVHPTLPPEVMIDAILSQPSRIAGDILEIDAHTWAIHGFIPVDGEVILAEYDAQEAARAVLDRLGAIEAAGGSA